MKKHLLNKALALLLAFVMLGMLAPAYAQTVTAQPNFAAPRTVVDLGNGPTEILPIIGNGFVFTAFGSATGTAPGTTALTLTTSQAANPPCIGCFVTCPSPVNCSIPASTTVAAFNGTTLITLSAVATITAAVVNFGQLCPVSTQSAPVQPTQAMTPIAGSQGAAGFGVPLYTQGRICAYGGTGPGIQFSNFPIGAH
jgi:hypothetical protein